MSDVYLFDWGDTLMVDFPGATGKMCDWETVEAVEGAEETLKYLSAKSQIYIATGASDSAEADIKKAFNRVGLDQYISGYFCEDNLGCKKRHPDFLSGILQRLEKEPVQVTMVGDNLKSDIEPAKRLGINAVWFNRNQTADVQVPVHTITTLRELVSKQI